MHWFPSKRQAGAASEIFVLACTDGTHLFSFSFSLSPSMINSHNKP